MIDVRTTNCHHELDALLRRNLEDWWQKPNREIDKALPTKKRPCAACGLKRTDSVDPCLGRLPGVRNACCGHGVKTGYIQFENGIIIRGVFHTEHGPGPGNTHDQ